VYAWLLHRHRFPFRVAIRGVDFRDFCVRVQSGNLPLAAMVLRVQEVDLMLPCVGDESLCACPCCLAWSVGDGV